MLANRRLLDTFPCWFVLGDWLQQGTEWSFPPWFRMGRPERVFPLANSGRHSYPIMQILNSYKGFAGLPGGLLQKQRLHRTFGGETTACRRRVLVPPGPLCSRRPLFSYCSLIPQAERGERVHMAYRRLVPPEVTSNRAWRQGLWVRSKGTS